MKYLLLMVRLYFTHVKIKLQQYLYVEQTDPGQLRVPRAKTFPDLVLHPVGHFQLAQNQQDPTRQDLIPHDKGMQEINFDYSDLVYEYPDYEDEEDEYYFLDDDKEKDYSNIKIERKPVTFKTDNFRLLFFL